MGRRTTLISVSSAQSLSGRPLRGGAGPPAVNTEPVLRCCAQFSSSTCVGSNAPVSTVGFQESLCLLSNCSLFIYSKIIYSGAVNPSELEHRFS